MRERNGTTVQLKRVSQTTLDGKYAPGLSAFWKFAVEHWSACGPVPTFEFGTKLNRPAAERDAYNEEEVLTFFGAPPFVDIIVRLGRDKVTSFQQANLSLTAVESSVRHRGFR